MLEYCYYPGCNAKRLGSETSKALKLCFDRLAIDITELDGAACCGAGSLQETDPLMAHVLNARTLAEAEAHGMDIVTPCNTCLLYLKRTKIALANDKNLLDEVNRKLSRIGMYYEGKIDVKHVLWILVDHFDSLGLDQRFAHKLEDVKVAPFYGCHILRPSAILGFEDSAKPLSLEKMISACGAENVDYGGKLNCCGFHDLLTDEEASTRMIAKIVRGAKQNGAQLIVTPCTLCSSAFDLYQAKSVDAGERLPVAHIMQLIGLSMMIPYEELGFNRHLVEPTILKRDTKALATGSSALSGSGVSLTDNPVPGGFTGEIELDLDDMPREPKMLEDDLRQ